MELADVLVEVVNEINLQDEKWGEGRDLHDLVWLPILMEEVGEVSTELLEGTWGRPTMVKEELIQVAAVTLQWLLNIYRSGDDRVQMVQK